MVKIAMMLHSDNSALPEAVVNDEDEFDAATDF
jgi:hypothetical protein